MEVGDQSITWKFTGVNEDFRWHIMQSMQIVIKNQEDTVGEIVSH